MSDKAIFKHKDEIPKNWELHFMRRGGAWEGSATKKEGVREIKIATYDSPKGTFEDCYKILKERISL